MIGLVRDNEPAVVRQILRLEDEAFGPGGLNVWHLLPLIRHGRVYVWRDNGTVVGVVEYFLDWEDARQAYMVGVAVAGDRRGRGSGTSLLAGSFKALAAEGIAAVELTVDPANAAAIRVYKDKFGFATIGLRRDEYGAGQDRLVMRLALADNAAWRRDKG